MKIKDVIIREFDTGGFDPMGNVTTGEPSASPTAVAAPAPGPAGMAKWPTTKDEIIAFQKANGLKADGLIGQKTMAALHKAGAKAPPGFKPVGPKQKQSNKPVAANTAADQATAAQTQTSNYTGVDQRTANARAPDAATQPNTNPLGVAQTANVPNPFQPAPEAPYGGAAANAMTAKSAPAPQANPLGVTAQSGAAFGQPAPQADNPNPPPGQSAQPATPDQPAKDPTVAPDLKSGTGQTWKDSSGKAIKSSSDDEIAWAAKNGGSFANRSMYPGPGNWDPKTGRTVKKDAQGNVVQDKSFGDKVSDFFGGLGKTSSGQGGQPATGDQSGGSTTGNKAFLPGAAGGAKEDIDRLRKLSGLR